ncbi:DNA repair protein XRCC2 homolog isoform X1 [Rhizophagus clarus]|uniref:DNA repair protein XRCC2 homolog isoform X1 n=1 Tax=Rhizophagus clarus TaxID=94130 RepID=A0A8H3QU70_9GLOM|nr:DNA repair protein XRCC2 homolog isoform X1 [Rhizophagus clarus]
MSTQRYSKTPANNQTFEPPKSPPAKHSASSVQITPHTPIQRQQHVNIPRIKPQPNYFHLPFLDNVIKKVYEYHNRQQERNAPLPSTQLYDQPYIHNGDVIELYGPSCGGKTTILYHVIVTTIIPKYWTRNKDDDEDAKIELNGLGKGVLFFDLDGRHDIKRLYTMIMYYLRNRIEQIVKERNSREVQQQDEAHLQLPTPLSSLSSQPSQEEQGEFYNNDSLPTEQELDMIARNSLKKLHIFQPNMSIEYLATLFSLPEYIKEIQEKEGYGFNYLMIDSINAFYWQDKSEEIGEQAINSGNGVDSDSDDDGGELDNFEIINEEGIDPTSSPMYYNGRQSHSRSSINGLNSSTSSIHKFQYYIVQALQILIQSTNLIILATNWVVFGPSEHKQKTVSQTNINLKIPQELNYTTVLSPYWDSLLKYKFVIAKQLLPQYSDDIIPQMVEKDENRRNLLKEPLFFGRLILPGCDEKCGEIFSFKISEKGIIILEYFSEKLV